MDRQAVVARPLLRVFTGLQPPDGVLEAIRIGDAAGVALYRALNVESPAQLRALGDAVQAAAMAGGHPTAIVAIDQEGGQLMGVGEPATQFGGNLALAAAGSIELVRQVGEAMGRELLAMGVNVSWAPDLDLATLPESPAVGARSFGDDPALAGAMGAATIAGLQGAGVAAAAKHFPGSGATLADPHHGLPVVTVSRETLEARELAPFRDAVAAGVRMIMISHAAYPALEPDGDATRPALRSPAILRHLLRDRMGFEGVVVSDALDMGAVDQSDVAAAAIDAIEAGVDLLLAGPGQVDRPEELADMVAALHASSAADVAAARVHELRRWLAGGVPPDLATVGCAEHVALARDLGRRSVTLVRDDARLLPVRTTDELRVAVITPTPTDLTPADTSSQVTLRLADAVRERHAATVAHQVTIDPSEAEIERAVGIARGCGLAILGTIDAVGHPAQLQLAREVAALGVPTILVALRMPTDVDALAELPTAIACYSIHDASTDAAAAGVFGEVEPSGRIPLAWGASPLRSPAERSAEYRRTEEGP